MNKMANSREIDCGVRDNVCKNNGPESLKSAELNSSAPVEPFKFAGYLASVLCSLACASGLLCVKLLPVENNIREKVKATMFRGIFMALFCAIGIVHGGLSFSVDPGEYLVNVLRCASGAFAMISSYVALNYITMGESIAIIHSAPIWTCLLGFIVLREPLRLSLPLMLPVSLLGIILMAQPNLILDQQLVSELGLAEQLNRSAALQVEVNLSAPIASSALETNASSLGPEMALDEMETKYFDRRWPGILAAFVVSLLTAFSIIVLKYRKKTPIVTCSFYLGCSITLLSVAVQSIIGFGTMPATWLEWTLHLCIGLISWANQCLFQWSLKFVTASAFSVARGLDIVLSFIMGAIFLHDVVPWTSVLGSCLIIVVVLVLALEEQIIRSLKSLLTVKTESKD